MVKILNIDPDELMQAHSSIIDQGNTVKQLEKQFSNIPEELKRADKWILWRYFETQNGKRTKIPYGPSGKIVSVTDDKSRWSFAGILQHYLDGLGNDIDGSNQFDGIGFVLSKDDPFVFIDLDYTENPDHMRLQAKIVEEFSGTYMERSPSGQGLHLICRGEIPAGKRRYSCEIYDNERYMTMTGDVFMGSKILDYKDKVSSLWEYLRGDRVEVPVEGLGVDSQAQTLEDEEVIRRATEAANGDVFQALWSGAWKETGKYQSQSDADLGLMNILVFYSKNDEQVRRLFLQSALGQRDKAKREDYLGMTLLRAKDNNLPMVDIYAFAKTMATKYEHFRRLESWDGVESYGTECPSYPPGLVGDVARFMEQQATCKVKLYALVGALGFIAGLAGRAYNVNNSGLNIFAIMLGESGSGKDLMSKGMSHLNKYIRSKAPNMMDMVGPETISSGQALIKSLQKRSSVCSVLSEFGYIYQSMIGGMRTNENMMMLKRSLLNLYARSGYGSEVGSTVYSDQDTNIMALQNPAFSMICETVGNNFWPYVTTSVIEDGFLPRFLIFEYSGPQLYHDYNADNTIDAELGRKLVDFASRCNMQNQSNQVQNVEWSDDARIASDTFIRELRDIENAMLKSQDGERGTAALYNRAGLNIIRVSALLAVGINPWTPVIDINCFNYAKNLVMSSVESVKRRFKNQDAAIEDFEQKQILEVKTYMAKFMLYSEPELEKLKFQKQMQDDGVIPMSYLQVRVSQLAAFKKDKIGATKAIEKVLKILTDNGVVQEMNKNVCFERYQTRQKCYLITNPDVVMATVKMREKESKRGKK